ncbi:hypothetical protein FZEAL_9061 [Fusarium zealandicum]|uniref:Uncharacterized protein n=1 Tax=Fusarium zealandicum TaxID=1053134 RepID=A0A8H4UD98_9HYPO|nr:hypothetical protein FZEAL_9061 [Fusarium zealandicum]
MVGLLQNEKRGFRLIEITSTVPKMIIDPAGDMVLVVPFDPPQATPPGSPNHEAPDEDESNPAPAPKPDGTSSKLLLDLAGVCDIYQCTRALKYSGGLWVRNWLLHLDSQTEPSVDDICRLFIFFYVLELSFEFTEIAWRLLMHHKGPLKGEQTQAVELIDHPLLDQDITWMRSGFDSVKHITERRWGH